MGYAPPNVSGSEKLLDFVEQDHEQSQPQCSNCEKVPGCRFEREAFMVAHDEEELKTIQESLYSHISKEWIKAMEEEMNSMEFNHV